MFADHVALPALRRTAGRVGEVLGLPQIVDHLFDMSPLPELSFGRRRLVRAGPQAQADQRPRATGLLAGTTGDGYRDRRGMGNAGARAAARTAFR